MRILPATSCLAAMALLAACGGNDDNCCVYATPGGLYDGTLNPGNTQQQDNVYAIVDENGYGRMIDYTSGDYYPLALNNNGLTLGGTYQVFGAAAGTPIQSGTVSGQLYVNGLSATLSNSNGTSDSLNTLLDFTYFNSSSVEMLAGNWSYDAGGNSFGITMSVAGTGNWTGTDTDGCSYSGDFALDNPYYDAYYVSYTQTCGQTADHFSGIAAYYYADSQYPSGIEILADDGAGSFLAVEVLSGPVPAVSAAATAGSRRPAPRVRRRSSI